MRTPAEPELRLANPLARFALVVAVTLIGVVALGLTLLVDASNTFVRAFQPSSALMLPVAVVVGVIGVVFALDKALQVRRLERELAHERAAAELLARRVAMHTALEHATEPLEDALDDEIVLDAIIGRATELLGASEGALLLREHGDVLRVAAVRGTRAVMHSRRPSDLGPAGRAMREQRPVAERAEDGAQVWCAPLVHRGVALGVIECSTYRVAINTDLYALALFAEPAAAAIARAQIVATEREHVDELLTLDRMQRAFVSGIGHDLRSPLTALRGAAAGLRRTTDARTRDELLAVIDRQVERIASFVQELVDIGTTDGSFEAPRLDLPSVIRLLALDRAVAGRPVVVDAPERLDVVADVEAVRRMVSNLIENAYQHGAAPVQIRVWTDASRAIVTVSDCGPGISSEIRESVFAYAARGSSSFGSGHGMGLAIVRSLAETCGGTAWIDDAPSGGAAVSVSLRMRDVTTQEAAWTIDHVS